MALKLDYSKEIRCSPGKRVRALAPHSEVCMHIGVAGTLVEMLIIDTGMVQLYSLHGNPISSPITYAEAGVREDDAGCYVYGYTDKPTRARIECERVLARDLNPGDLFSTAGPDYWQNFSVVPSVGERVYIRTNCPADNVPDADTPVYRIKVIQE